MGSSTYLEIRYTFFFANTSELKYEVALSVKGFLENVLFLYVPNTESHVFNILHLLLLTAFTQDYYLRVTCTCFFLNPVENQRAVVSYKTGG